MEKEMKIYKFEITLSSKLEYFVEASSKEDAEKIADSYLDGDTDRYNNIVTTLDENSCIDWDIKETNLKEEDVDPDDLLDEDDY